jgi:predicted 2-oxoglutarate/Fe(II)-dependent dioxygenase YbiX
MSKLFNENQIKFLNDYWVNVDFRTLDDRSYEFTTLHDDTMGIISTLLKWFENESGIKLKSYKHSLIIHRYVKGDKFEKHIDSIEENYKNRAYVVGLHINNDYEGGDYVLYEPYDLIDKTPGNPYFFKTDRLHEIKEITNGIRKSALLFINHEDYIKTKLL